MDGGKCIKFIDMIYCNYTNIAMIIMYINHVCIYLKTIFRYSFGYRIFYFIHVPQYINNECKLTRKENYHLYTNHNFQKNTDIIHVCVMR